MLSSEAVCTTRLASYLNHPAELVKEVVASSLMREEFSAYIEKRMEDFDTPFPGIYKQAFAVACRQMMAEDRLERATSDLSRLTSK